MRFLKEELVEVGSFGGPVAPALEGVDLLFRKTRKGEMMDSRLKMRKWSGATFRRAQAATLPAPFFFSGPRGRGQCINGQGGVDRGGSAPQQPQRGIHAAKLPARTMLRRRERAA